MKLVERRKTALVFELREWERRVLRTVLGLYPQIPPDNFMISKSGLPAGKADEQKLHHELFAETQGGNRKLVQQFIREALADDTSASPHQPLSRFTLERARVDWLLQVLNDVRVGSWVKLGRPDEATLRKLARQPDVLPQLEVMEFCAYAQMVLLDAVGS